MDNVTYVSPEEFGDTVKRIELRRKAIRKARRRIDRCKTLDERIEAYRELNAAVSMPV